MRRRVEPRGDPPSVLFPTGASIEDPELASYVSLVEQFSSLQSELLEQALQESIDLDSFLAWIAMQTILRNGDYTDEIFFYASDSVSGGSVVDFFRFAAWDMDDLFSNCHFGGEFALSDVNGLLYCTEGDLEKAILTDETIYRRYVDILEQLLNGLVGKEAVLGGIL